MGNASDGFEIKFFIFPSQHTREKRKKKEKKEKKEGEKEVVIIPSK